MPKFQVEDFIADLEPVDYDTGFWCRRCLLPSGVRIVAMITIGPSSHLRTFHICTDCKSFAVDPK
jgi:hypothetical protein